MTLGSDLKEIRHGSVTYKNIFFSGNALSLISPVVLYAFYSHYTNNPFFLFFAQYKNIFLEAKLLYKDKILGL